MNRRLAPRRATQRRPVADERPAPESWFAAIGVEQDTQIDEESRYNDGNTLPSEDSRFLTRHARRLLGSGIPSFQRIFRAFLGARVVVGLLLLSTQLASAGLGTAGVPWPVLAGCAAYAVLTLVTWFAYRRAGGLGRLPVRLNRTQWLGTIVVDVVAFGSLHLLAPRGGLNFVPLLVLPVLMAGVLTRRRTALAVAATVTLMLFGEAWREAARGADLGVLMTQAGLVASGFFVIAILAGEMAGRLAREELAARGSLELARQQAQLNRLVIDELHHGVLVVDRRGKVRAANPAARRIISDSGLARPAPFPLQSHPAWEPLAQAVRRAFAEGQWPAAGREIHLKFDSGVERVLRVRMRFTRRRDPDSSEELCVLFLEDERDVQARVRQEKLAAMGRISAGIAHEIRNPLAAIAQANALLAEDADTPAQRRLTQMVSDNVERLKRIVDDVMEVAPGGPAAAAAVVDLTALVATICHDWARTAGLPSDEHSALRLNLPSQPVGSRFDPDHLRRVLVNLLDNAYRHASGRPGSVEVHLYPDGEQVVTLSVASDGEPIPPEVERYLFEPFFSTRSRGTGLGLYICKELCERYGATIDYRLRGAHHVARNEFYLVMRREALDASAPTLHLDT
ncbi:ATP-binding protein [Caldimonas sp.]|uniref:sensor histidine kinase n=1 Tax=Caldimonas sp. TaxID=2838790 RepID=UPI00307E2467